MFIPKPYPKLIKYMGSKSKIMDFVVLGLNVMTKKGQPIIDLFSGSATLAGAVGAQHDFITNDIQAYSSVLARTYLESLKNEFIPSATTIVCQANEIVSKNKKYLGFQCVSYSKSLDLNTFKVIENEQQKLINECFFHEYHIFTKNYSGTWWSFEQCLWIDAIREVAERYKHQSVYPFVLSSLMHAMAYSSQGTGHYAQYREPTSRHSLNDICIYRQREISVLFTKKYEEICNAAREREKNFSTKYESLDYKEALSGFSGGTVYADPPYSPTHYSRFYHILETLVLYDHPDITKKNGAAVKGRYRVDRHQSPFGMKTKVKGAFVDLFEGVSRSNSSLVLSYSNTGMLSVEELIEIASTVFSIQNIDLLTTDSRHATLGRREEGVRDVKEYLLLAQ